MKAQLTTLLLFLCFACKAQLSYIEFDSLADNLLANNLIGSERVSPMPWCSSGCVVGEINTGKIIEDQSGYTYSKWNSKPVPQKGYYQDTEYYSSKYYKNITKVRFAVFYNAQIVFMTELYGDTAKINYFTLVDTAYLREITK